MGREENQAEEQNFHIYEGITAARDPIFEFCLEYK